MSAPRSYRTVAAVLATAVLVPIGLIGVGSATAQGSSTGTPATQTQGQGEAPGHRDHGPDIATLAAKLGVTAAQLKAALDATRPSGKPPRGDHGAGFATAVAGALGVSVDKVQPILEANRPAQPPVRPAAGTKPDLSGLVSALSTSLGIDKAAVQAALDKVLAAHRAEAETRHAAMATALAKTLNLDVAKVKQALAELHPAGRP